MKLVDNRQLYEYLLSLSNTLTRSGAESLSLAVTTAARYAAGMSTEFLGESRIALRKVAQDRSAILNEAERAELLAILQQLDFAFDKR